MYKNVNDDNKSNQKEVLGGNTTSLEREKAANQRRSTSKTVAALFACDKLTPLRLNAFAGGGFPEVIRYRIEEYKEKRTYFVGGKCELKPKDDYICRT